MDNLISLSTTNWWFSVFAVGIFINIISARLQGPFDGFLGIVFKWLGTLSKKGSQERDNRIAKLKQSKDEQTFAFIESLHVLVFAVMQLLFSLLAALAAVLFLLTMPIEAQMRQGIPLSNLLTIAAILTSLCGISGLLEVLDRRYELIEARQYDDIVDAVLIKADDGPKDDGIKAKVNEDGIIIYNAKLLIETGDRITIKLKPPFGRKETYEVLDIDPSKMPGSHLVKVRKRKTLNE